LIGKEWDPGNWNGDLQLDPDEACNNEALTFWGAFFATRSIQSINVFPEEMVTASSERVAM
jgi:hypothetical protein